TLKQVAEESKNQLKDSNVLVLEINEHNQQKVRLNYPSRTDFLGLLLVKNGKVFLEVDSKRVELKKGEIIVLFPSNIVEFHNFSEDNLIEGIFWSTNFLTEIGIRFNVNSAFEIFSKNYKKRVFLNAALFDRIVFLIERIK